MEDAVHTYFYYLLFFVTALLLSAAALKFSFFMSRVFSRVQREYPDRKEPYAGGFPALQRGKKAFPVRFATISLLFVLYNAEILLLLPWAASLRMTGRSGFVCAFVYFVFWAVAYAYEYKKGALDWK